MVLLFGAAAAEACFALVLEVFQIPVPLPLGVDPFGDPAFDRVVDQILVQVLGLAVGQSPFQEHPFL